MGFYSILLAPFSPKMYNFNSELCLNTFAFFRNNINIITFLIVYFIFIVFYLCLGL